MNLFDLISKIVIGVFNMLRYTFIVLLLFIITIVILTIIMPEKVLYAMEIFRKLLKIP